MDKLETKIQFAKVAMMAAFLIIFISAVLYLLLAGKITIIIG